MQSQLDAPDERVLAEAGGNQPAEPMTAATAAATLDVNERTVRRAIARGDLPTVKFAGTYRITPADLAAYRVRLNGSTAKDGAPRRVSAGGQEAAESHIAPVSLLTTLRPAPPLPVPPTPLIGRGAETDERQPCCDGTTSGW